MANVRTRERKAREPLVEPLPGEPALAAASQRAIPSATDFIIEGVHGVPVARQTVIAIVPTQHAAQPPMLVRQRRVHASTLFRPHRVQFPRESLSVGPPLHDEAAVSTPRTVVRETEDFSAREN